MSSPASASPSSNNNNNNNNSASTPRRARKKDPGLSAGTADLVATGGEENVCVAIRVRPFNRRELDLHQQNNSDEYIRSVIEMPDGVNGTVRMLHRDATTGEYSELETFKFTKSLWSIAEEQQPHKFLPITQEDVFDSVGRIIVLNALGGFNSCMFAYGQTGAGKSYSITGNVETINGDFAGDPGVVPRLCKEIFVQCQQRKEEMEAEVSDGSLTVSFDIKLSSIQIYNEAVNDLFWKSTVGRTKTTVLKVRTHPTDGAFVDQLTVLNPKSWVECVKLIADGISQRTVAATLMNSESSRSHSVFQITIVTTETQGPPRDDVARKFEKPVVSTRQAKISIVDLAGSERLKKSGAQGQQLKEAAGINQSLSTLKKVIDALVTNGTEKNPKKHVLVPYRESTLTQLLSHSLGGNSKTTMIACVSPHYDNQEETLLTLRYANRTKGIVNHVKCNEDNAQKQALLLKDQIARLQERLSDPSANDPTALAELRDQIAVGERELHEREEKRRQAEVEAEKIGDRLRHQKEARFAAAYYNAFKRVWLTRQREQCETELDKLETHLRGTVRHREALSEKMIDRERAESEAKLTIEDLKRRESAFVIKNARTQAKCRELSRDITKTKKRQEELLTSRYASVFVRNQHQKKLEKELEGKIDETHREHEQYLSSLTREAKKQFDNLVSNYSERELIQQDKLEAVERQLAHANTQLEKSEQVHAAAQLLMKRAKGEYDERESERDKSWQRRFEQMKTVYQDKRGELEVRLAKDRLLWQDELESLHSGASTAADDPSLDIRRIEILARMKQVAHDGDRRAQDVANATIQNGEAAMLAGQQEHEKEIQSLSEQFANDEAALLQHLYAAQNRISTSVRELQRLSMLATGIEDAAFRSENVLGLIRRHAKEVLGDAPETSERCGGCLHDMEVFNAETIAASSNFELPRVHALIRRSQPMLDFK